MAYVGPPDQYDLMGATQFRLLTTLGLRAFHSVLDFGCGSLRLGKLLIPYLDPGRYYGLDPNRWLIEDAIRNELGKGLTRLKRPRFFHHSDFDASQCGSAFDFIVAQSIFSHAGIDVIEIAVKSMARCLDEKGLVLLTAIWPGQDGTAEYMGKGWVYPGCVAHRPEALSRVFERAGFYCRPLPWFHPRQTWYVLALDSNEIPPCDLDSYLTGATFRVPEFAESLTRQRSGNLPYESGHS